MSDNIQQLENDLKALKKVFSEMTTLFEWHKLKQAESVNNPSLQLRFCDDTPAQLYDKYSEFMSISISLQDKLQLFNGKKKSAKIIAITKEFTRLQYQVHYLDGSVRFY